MKKWWIAGLIAVAIVLLAAIIAFRMVFHRPAPNGPAEHVFAHMGGSGHGPEHSLEAYDISRSLGVTHLEQDVVISRDGTLYACHDLSAKRLADDDRMFSKMTDEEIGQIVTHLGTKILPLEEIIDRYKKDKDVVFVMELKDAGARDALIDFIKEKKLQQRVILQSINLTVLQECKNTLPLSTTLYLTKDPIDFKIALTQYYMDIVSWQQAYLSKDHVDAAHEAGKLFNTWVCDTEDEIRRAIEAGADSYFTNYPKQAMELEKNLRGS